MEPDDTGARTRAAEDVERLLSRPWLRRLVALTEQLERDWKDHGEDDRDSERAS